MGNPHLISEQVQVWISPTPTLTDHNRSYSLPQSNLPPSHNRCLARVAVRCGTLNILFLGSNLSGGNLSVLFYFTSLPIWASQPLPPLGKYSHNCVCIRKLPNLLTPQNGGRSDRTCMYYIGLFTYLLFIRLSMNPILYIGKDKNAKKCIILIWW